MSVAKIILQQLGGNRFCVMTGAKSFVGGENFLQFRIPATLTKDGINCVKITLNASDLYDVEFYKLRGVNSTKVKTVNDVYCDQLEEIFEDSTGLLTHM